MTGRLTQVQAQHPRHSFPAVEGEIAQLDTGTPPPQFVHDVAMSRTFNSPRRWENEKYEDSGARFHAVTSQAATRKRR